MKRVVSMVLAVAILVGMLPTTAWATEMETVGGTCGENLSWTFDESSGSLKISGTGDMDDYSWSQMYDPTSESSDIWVTDAPWRDYYNAIKSIVIESDVTSIGDGAFRGCSAVTSISLSNDVEALGEYSFMDCDGIIDIVIPENVKTIGEAAFSDCNALESVSILGAASIGNFAFSECANLISVELPDTLTSIGEYGFRGCEALRTVTIPSSVRTIGTFAFVWCESLNEICFEGSAPSMDGTILSGLTCNVSYPSDDETWSEELQKEFDDTITWNGNSSDEGTSGSSHSHSYGDWYETKAPTQEAEGEERRDCIDCDYYETRITEKLPVDEEPGNSCGENLTWELDTATGTLVISGTGTMDNSWWPYETPSESPNFAPWHDNAANIKSVVINSGVTSIGHFAFFDCVNLTNVSIPEGVTFIGCAFVGCDSLEELYIPASVTDFRYPSNEGVCTGLTKIVVDVSNSVYSSDEAGMLYNKDKTKFIGCPTGYQGAYTIADSVIEIGDWAFYACTSLTSVDVPTSVTTIGISAFNSCAKLDGIVIPDGVTTIGMFTFAYCAGLTEITIPKNVTALGNGVFTECTALAEVRFEGDAPDIDYECFNQTSTTAYYPAGNSTWTEDKLSNYCGNIQWVEYADNVNQCGDELFWEFDADTKTLTISGKGEMYDFPDAGSPWYSLNAEIDHVVISEGATSIGNYAFVSCGMDDIEIPNSVTRIGEGSFALSGIESIKIPGSVTTIEEYTFTRSTLNSIALPEQLKVIEENAFAETPLTAITLPNTLTEIGAEAFWGTMLTSVAIPENVSVIGAGAFAWCEDLTSISVAAGNANFAAKNGVLFDKNETTLIQYPAKKDQETYNVPVGTSIIGAYAFSGVKALKQVELPGDLNSLEKCAFIGCSGLTEMNIPENVSSFGLGLFDNCRDLKNITFTGDAPVFAEHWISEDMNLTAYHPADNETWTDEVKQNYGGKITWVVSCDHSFGDWYETKAPTEEVEGEERRDCEKCEHYETRSVPQLPHEHEYTSKVTAPTCTEQGYTTYTCRCSDSYVDNYVRALDHSWGFWWEKTAPTCTMEGINQRDCQRSGCDAAETENIDSLGHSYGEWYETKAPTKDEEGEERRDCEKCEYYETRVIEKLTGIGGDCGENITWVFDEASRILTIRGSGEMSPFYNGKTPWYDYRLDIQQVIILDGVTSLGSHAFADCGNMISVTIPNSVKRIGWSVFDNCSSLISVDIPNRVSSIGNYAFRNCTNLINVNIPNGVEYIYESAFNNCCSLTSVIIPDSVKEFGESVFRDCTSLSSVIISSNNIEFISSSLFYNCVSLKSISIPDGVRGIGESAFYNCSSLTNVIIPDSLESISEYAFRHCSSLVSIAVPSGVNYIGDAAFGSCTSLHSFVIPDGLNEIPACMFQSCNSLKNVTIPSSIKTISMWAFEDCNNLHSITIPTSVSYIGMSAFKDCVNFTDVYYPGSEKQWMDINIHSTNKDLLNATIHYNSTGPNNPILPLSGWQKAYYDFIVQNKENYEKHAEYKDWNDGVRYELLYIDNDDIPELFISYDEGCYYGDYGFIFAQYKEGKIECFSESFGTATIEYLNKGSIYALKYYNNRYWFETVASLENKESSTLGYSSNVDSDGNLGSTFEWNNKSVTEAKYNEKRNEVLDPTETAITLSDNSKIHNYNGILEYLMPKAQTNYDSVLDEYRKVCAMDEDTFFEKYNKTEYPYTNRDVMVRYYMEGDKQFVYVYHDIDNNGTDELLIGYGNEDGIDIIGLYAFNGTEAVKLMFATGEKILLDVFEDGMIRQQRHESWNSTITEYYRLDASGYKLMEVSAGSMAEIQNFEWVLLDASETTDKTTVAVRYYSVWDEGNETARFGPNDQYGSKVVTDETELSFRINPTALLGQYVLVETKPRTDGQKGPDTLISMRAVETKTGTVSAANTESITIGSETYDTPANLTSPESYTNQFVVYHLYNGNLAGIEILKEIEGVLTYWNAEANSINIKQNVEDETKILYHLSSLGDKNVLLDIYNSSSRSETVRFLADSNNLVYYIEQILPQFEIGKDNFSFINQPSDFFTAEELVLWNEEYTGGTQQSSYVSFLKESGLNANYQITDSAFARLIGGMDENVITALRTDRERVWSGSCFGMSLTMAIRSFAPELLPVDDLDISLSDSLDTYQIARPSANWRIEDVINYYQLIYNYPYFINRELLLSQIVQSDYQKALDQFVDFIENDEIPTVVAIAAEENGNVQSAHAVIALDIIAEDQESYTLKVYDPNRQEFSEMYVYKTKPSSFTDSNITYPTLRIRYASASTAGSESRIYNCIYNYAGLKDALDLRNYFTENSSASPLGGTSYLTPFISVEGNTNISMHSPSASFSYQNLHFEKSNNVFGPYLNPSDGKNSKIPTYRFLLNVDDIDETYKISLNPEESSCNAMVSLPSWSIAVSGSSALHMELNSSQQAITLSSNTPTDMSMLITWNNSEDMLGSRFAVDVNEATFITIIPTDSRVTLSSDNLQNAEIAVEDKTSVQTIEYSGDKDTIILQKEQKDIILKDHVHTAREEWVSDNNSHWHICNSCKEIMDLAAHSGGIATCTKKAVCAVCGVSYGNLADHDYETSWSQGDANGHWHECKNCSAHDTQVKHTPGAAATEDTAQFCTVCGYVITPALGHTCTAGTKWYSNGTYHWHLCTSCGAWVKTSYHSYSGDTDETCNVCGYVRTVTATEPTQETEVAMTETIEASVSDEEVIATDTVPVIVPTETNENLSDNAVSEDTDSRGVSGVLITVFAIVALGSLAALAILLVYKKRRKSE